MNWNNYDTKYIIKRLIIGFGMLILFSILTANKAKAQTWSNAYNNYYSPNQGYVITTSSWNYQVPTNLRNYWANKKGQLIFTMYQAPVTTGAELVREVIVKTGGNTFACNMGNVTFYNDNNTIRAISTVTCQVEFDNYGWSGIEFIMPSSASNNTYVLLSSQASLTETMEEGTIAISTQLTDIYNKLNTGFSDLYNMTNQQFNIISGQLTNIYNLMTTQNQSITTAINNASNQAHQDSQAINDSINNDNVDGANNDLDNFKNSSTFSDSTGLQAVLELPLNLVNSFTNTCQPISITIPFMDYTGTIPCMSTIYRNHFNGLYSVVALIVNAFFIYRILLKIYELVHSAKQPDEDKLEVIDL